MHEFVAAQQLELHAAFPQHSRIACGRVDLRLIAKELQRPHDVDQIVH